MCADREFKMDIMYLAENHLLNGGNKDFLLYILFIIIVIFAHIIIYMIQIFIDRDILYLQTIINDGIVCIKVFPAPQNRFIPVTGRNNVQTSS